MRLEIWDHDSKYIKVWINQYYEFQLLLPGDARTLALQLRKLAAQVERNRNSQSMIVKVRKRNANKQTTDVYADRRDNSSKVNMQPRKRRRNNHRK